MSYTYCTFKESWWRQSKHYSDRDLAEYLRGLLGSIFDGTAEPPEEKELLHLGWFHGHQSAVRKENGKKRKASETPSETPSETLSETPSETPSKTPSGRSTKLKKVLPYEIDETDESVAHAGDVLSLQQIVERLEGPSFAANLRPENVQEFAQEFFDAMRAADWFDVKHNRRHNPGSAMAALVSWARTEKTSQKKPAARVISSGYTGTVADLKDA